MQVCVNVCEFCEGSNPACVIIVRTSDSVLGFKLGLTPVFRQSLGKSIKFTLFCSQTDTVITDFEDIDLALCMITYISFKTKILGSFTRCIMFNLLRVACITLTCEQVQIHFRILNYSTCCYKFFVKFLNNLILENTFTCLFSVHDTIRL